MTITSRHNPRIKQIRALQARKERERTRLFFVDGARAVAEAVQARRRIELLVVAPDRLTTPLAGELVRSQRAAGVPCLEVSAEVFATLTPKESTPGLGAVLRQRWEPSERLQCAGELCWIALESVQYPGNLGTILRTGDAAGAGGVILLGQTADPHDPAAVRASLGAILSQRLARMRVDEFATWTRRQGCAVIGAAPDATTDYRAIAYPPPLVLLMGSERDGLSAGQRALCDAVVRIPMLGRRDSLNLAIATSLLVYEVFRQRHPIERAASE
jgi:TrmH family RNA methyltransferase